MSATCRAIPVLSPRLPTADCLLPYLREIDRNRIYSNFGPLALRLEARLAARWNRPAGAVVSAGNATVGLSAALMAWKAPRGSLCLIPSWTFVASGHAALAAGLVPHLVDVDPATGMLTPALAEAELAAAPGPVGAVMVVGPFGAPVDGRQWEDFHRRTGVPVVIDAAAGFDTAAPCALPMVVSLHATKALGAGEGGFVTCDDGDLARDIRRLVNFGFLGERVSPAPALNGKMSEYHAAVALAALDQWGDTRAAFLAMLSRQRAALADVKGMLWPEGLGSDYVASTLCVRLPAPAEDVAAALAGQGIETRRWWQGGMHTHPAFAPFATRQLPVTADLARHTLGLPCRADMTDDEIGRVAATLAETLGRA